MNIFDKFVYYGPLVVLIVLATLATAVLLLGIWGLVVGGWNLLVFLLSVCVAALDFFFLRLICRMYGKNSKS